MSILSPKGFIAASGSLGVKGGGAPDCAVVIAEKSAVAAGVFTSNKIQAAPVQVSKSHLESTNGHARAVVVTSGNANAATGKEGIEAADALCATAAKEISSQKEDVLICQTGLIGIPFPLHVVAQLPEILSNAKGDESAAHNAALAMMTTDTVPKEVQFEGNGFVLGGMAKGAAMLAPNMATMLAILTTDIAADPMELNACLQRSVAKSFNRMTIDGCQSTNDTVIILASGLSGKSLSTEKLANEFEDILDKATQNLSNQMVADAEGGTKVAHIEVLGAVSNEDAHKAARQVADSLLVKCSLFGEDPYWGRVASELGCAPISLTPDLVSIAYGGVQVCSGGIAVNHDQAAVSAHMKQQFLHITCDLGLGSGKGAVFTSDLSYAYIDENKGTS